MSNDPHPLTHSTHAEVSLHVNTGNSESEPLHITPNPPTPQEQQQAEIAPVLPALNTAYAENRPRLISYLTAGFHNNMSEGVALFDFGEAVETQYAPRNEMTPPSGQRSQQTSRHLILTA